ncbi:MAG: hypothetical protein IJ725_03090 [Ruminococcus sp.]|nr:hypothetical protein [Ruminococcus sp.]
MPNNYYYAIENLKPSESAVNKAVSAALEAEKQEKIIELKPMNSKKKFTIISVIAASLAVVIALSAVFYPSELKTAKPVKNKDNSFFLVANAAEATADEVKLNGNTFTPIAKLTRNGGTTRFISNDNNVNFNISSKARAKLEINSEENWSSILSADCFDFDFDCKGNNIKKVTYTIDSGSFRIRNTENLSELKRAYLLGEYDKEDTEDNLYDDEYSTFTVDESKQSKLSKIELVAGAELLVENLPDSIIRAAGFDEIIYHNGFYKNAGDVKKDLDEYLDYVFKDLSVKVKVTYDDNSTETKTLKFIADGKVTEFERDKDSDGTYSYYWETDIDVKAKLK